MDDKRIADLEVLLGHSFQDRTLLVNALSHSSIKSDDRPSNERMEFLGDAVLGLVLSEALYRRFPDENEGVLTRIKSHAVSRAALERIASAMALDRYILVGKGVRQREIPSSLLGNLFEALIGAIYLDAGLAKARKFILRHLRVVVDEIVEDRAERNYKSLLQHHVQKEESTVPHYKVVRESGPPHSRQFEVAVRVNNGEVGRAKAGSKKEAEQGAARAALIRFKVVDEDPRKEARGAGTIVGNLEELAGTKRKRRRSRRRSGQNGNAAEPAASSGERGRSRRKKSTAAKKKTSRAAKKKAPAAAAPRKKSGKKAAPAKSTKKSGSSSSAKKKPSRKRKTSRSRAARKDTSVNRGGSESSGSGPVAAAPGSSAAGPGAPQSSPRTGDLPNQS